MSESVCQVAHCMNASRVELPVGEGLVIDVCRPCATEETARAFSRGSNIGLYSYAGRRVVIACEGEPPIPRKVGFSLGVPRWCEAPPVWSPYLIPCIRCNEEFTFNPLSRCSLVCPTCDDRPAAAAQASEQPEEETVSAKEEVADFSPYKPPWGDAKPFWESFPPKLRDAASERYEERAAIKEFDGEQPKMIAEMESYEEVGEVAVEAGLVKHEQLGLFG